jgi:hypothetical protein
MPVREERTPLAAQPAIQERVLPISLISQEKNNWCWAACAAMVLTHRGRAFGNQCALAVLVLPFVTSLDCCDGRPDGACDLPALDDEITDLYLQFQIQAQLVGQVLEADLVAEINNNAPVEIGYRGSGFGLGNVGHVVIVYGWQRDNSGGISFFIHDPLTQSQTVRPFFALAGGINSGQWDATWRGL